MSNRKSMNIGDLPQHLRKMKERGETGFGNRGPVMQMGQLTKEPESNFAWYKAALATVFVFVFTIGGLVTYDSMSSSENITVVVDVDQNVNRDAAIASIVSESGGEITAVRQRKDLAYEVEVSTKNKQSFLNWLQGKRFVRRVSVEE